MLVSFGTFELRPAGRLLSKAGKPVRLGGRALDLLIALVERPGEIISQRELYDRVWPKRQVDDSSLRVNIAALRRALGDGADGVRYVENVPGRGYCFVAPVSRSDTSGGSQRTAASAPSGAIPDPATFPTNLPQGATALIGRERELVDLRESVGRDRAVTLVGPGGIGKTRLAIEFGWQMGGRFPDGVWLIDLAPFADPAVLIGTTAAVLGVTVRDAAAALETIVAAIRERRMLLIFDNCEHLIAAAADFIEALLTNVPGLSVLATSQESLNIRLERIFRLAPLALPPPGSAQIASFGAVALFIERAAMADRRFRLTSGNIVGVAEICRRLDGVPLALEMAAARLPLLGVEGLRAGLNERLQMLKAGTPMAEGRHATLRDTMEWSHGLLDAGDQQVLRRLAVFAGSFSLNAVSAVAGAGADRWDVVDRLGRLIDKSLVKIEDGASPRFRLLETIRLYAAEKLAESGEGAAITAGHARYLIEFFQRSDALWEVTPPEEWLAIYRPEIDNIRAALDWAFADPARTPIVVALAGATARLWDLANMLAEGRRYVDRAVDLIDDATPPAIAARLLRHAGGLWVNADRARSLALVERSATLYRQSGERLNLAAVLGVQGYLYSFLGRNDEAMEELLAAHEMLQGSDYRKSQAVVTTSLGVMCMNMQDVAGAQRWYGESLDLARKLKDKRREYLCLSNLAEVEFMLGATDRAVELQREAVAGLKLGNSHYIVGWGMVNLTGYLIVQGNLAEARSVAEAALATVRDLGGFVVWKSLEKWALLGALEGRQRDAARLIGFVNARRAGTGEVREPAEQQVYERLRDVLAAELPATEIEALAAEAALWDEAQAVEFAIDQLIAPGGVPNVTAI